MALHGPDIAAAARALGEEGAAGPGAAGAGARNRL